MKTVQPHHWQHTSHDTHTTQQWLPSCLQYGLLAAQVCVMSCDYILPPVFADYFSLSSVHGLLHVVLKDWLQWHRLVMSKQTTLCSPLQPYLFKQATPRLLPFLVSKFKLWR